MAFRLGENNQFTFEGECEADPENMLMGLGTPGIQPKQIDLARQFLMSELGGGELMAVKVLIDKAEKIGVGYECLRRAKKELNIRSEKISNEWFWKSVR